MVKRFIKALLRRSYRLGVFFVQSRLELPHILNARGLVFEGAEVGVQQGDFSEWILGEWQGQRLYSIDPWREYDLSDYPDDANVTPGTHELFYEQALAKLRPFGDRSRVMRTTSQDAVTKFSDGQLDFVYIDAQHHYEAVREDIAVWFPKVRPGGILCGHDYLDGVILGGTYGVKSAVDQFVASVGGRLVVTRDRPHCSWLVITREETRGATKR